MSRTARHTPASRSLLLIDSLLGLAAFATAVPTLLALAAAQAWWLELFSHFRLQYLAAQLVLLAALALRRRWRMSLLLIPLAALNASATSAYWPREPNPVSGRPDVRIMTANLYEDASDAARFIPQAQREDPDVLALVEFSHEWQAALSTLTAEYPYSSLEPRHGSFGIALLSRLPIIEQRSFELLSSTTLDVRLALPDGRALRLLAVHLRPPQSPRLAGERNRQLTELGKIVSRIDEPLIVIGDFNTTPYSPLFKDWSAQTGLRDARTRWSFSWPASFPLLGIPIDHCMISEHFIAGEQRRGEAFGSDHYPILTELYLRGDP
ncbi:MAG TPA: endonuclease/exonuclease/phosphatase family protein [Gammaproteobacteria bacterium]|jgi:endonuclease/exonuclease/phosphatase (EEP) superfamily protein YafD